MTEDSKSARAGPSAWLFGLLGMAAVSAVVATVLTVAPSFGGARQAPHLGAASEATPEPLSPDAGEEIAAQETVAPERPPPQQPPPLEAKLRKKGVGKVALEVTPWAEIFEGRMRLGATPVEPFEMTAGTHTLTFKNSVLGATKQERVRVLKGKVTSLQVNLEE